jgi:hypothetical protein
MMTMTLTLNVTTTMLATSLEATPPSAETMECPDVMVTPLPTLATTLYPYIRWL